MPRTTTERERRKRGSWTTGQAQEHEELNNNNNPRKKIEPKERRYRLKNGDAQYLCAVCDCHRTFGEDKTASERTAWARCSLLSETRLPRLAVLPRPQDVLFCASSHHCKSRVLRAMDESVCVCSCHVSCHLYKSFVIFLCGSIPFFCSLPRFLFCISVSTILLQSFLLRFLSFDVSVLAVFPLGATRVVGSARLLSPEASMVSMGSTVPYSISCTFLVLVSFGVAPEEPSFLSTSYKRRANAHKYQMFFPCHL